MASVNETGIKTFEAASAISQFRRVKLSGGKVAHADTHDDWIGVAQDAAAMGERVAVKLREFPGTRKMVAASAIASGARVYAAAAGKVEDTYTGAGRMVGVALDAASGDGEVIEVLPESGGSQLLYNIIAPSAAGGTSSSSEFTFSNGSVTIPAADVKPGDILRVKASGNHPSTNAADTFTGRLYVNTELVASTPSPDADNGDVFTIEAEIQVRAADKIIAHGFTYNDAPAAGLATPFATAELTEDLSSGVTISIRGIWSAASAGNESRLRQFSVERVRR